MGWATAWSFDALRLWLEKGIDPTLSLLRSWIRIITALVITFIWMYQGLVPKLLFPGHGEREIVQGISGIAEAELVLWALGVGEIAFGLMFLFYHRSSILYWIHMGVLLWLGFGALLGQPSIFVAPFNPVTLTFAMMGLSLIALSSMGDIPKSGNCRRNPNRQSKQGFCKGGV